MRELPEAAHALHNIRKSPLHGDRTIVTASRTDRPHLMELPILQPFQTCLSLSTHFSDDYFLFHAHLSCFILLFKKISWQVSPVRAAVQLSRAFCHLWFPGLNNGSYFVKQSFCLLPHPNMRADLDSYQQSSLLLDCHCFPQGGQIYRGWRDVTFGVTSQRRWITCDTTGFSWKHTLVRHAQNWPHGKPYKVYLPCASGINLSPYCLLWHQNEARAGDCVWQRF